MIKQWLYNKNAEPTIFSGQEAIDKAQKDGWVDTPAAFKEKDAIDAIIVPDDDLQSLEREELFEIAQNEEVKFAKNIGNEKLIDKIRANRNQ